VAHTYPYYSKPKPTEVVRKTNSAKDSKLFALLVVMQAMKL